MTMPDKSVRGSKWIMTGLTFSSIMVANNTSCYQGGNLVRNNETTMHCASPPTSNVPHDSGMKGRHSERNCYRAVGWRRGRSSMQWWATLSSCPIELILLAVKSPSEGLQHKISKWRLPGKSNLGQFCRCGAADLLFCLSLTNHDRNFGISNQTLTITILLVRSTRGIGGLRTLME